MLPICDRTTESVTHRSDIYIFTTADSVVVPAAVFVAGQLE